MRCSANLHIDGSDVRRSLLAFPNFNSSVPHLLCEWQTKFGSDLRMQITVWSLLTGRGNYVTQGLLFCNDVLVARTDMEIDKVVGEYSANWGGHEYVVNVYDSLNQEPTKPESAEPIKKEEPSADENRSKVTWLRTDQVTLKITHIAKSHPSTWAWDILLHATDGESVRVVEEDRPSVMDDDGDRIDMSWRDGEGSGEVSEVKCGGVARCSLGMLGLVTSETKVLTRYGDQAWMGVQLSPDKAGKEWCSSNPTFVAESVEELVRLVEEQRWISIEEKELKEKNT